MCHQCWKIWQSSAVFETNRSKNILRNTIYITAKGYRYYFHDVRLRELRLLPNPMDALLAFRRLIE